MYRFFHFLKLIRQYSSYSSSLKTLTPLLQSLPRISQTHHFPQTSNLISPNSPPNQHTHFAITRHFSSIRSDDSEDSEDYDDDEDEMGESLDEDDIVSGSSGKREYTAEEKESEAAAIGYKVVGPLERSDRVFKDYEPIFAVIQIGSHQFKVSNGDCVYTEKLKFCEVHDKDEIISRIEERISAWAFLPRENSHLMNIMHFGPEDFKQTYDFFGNQPKLLPTEKIMATIIFSLSNVSQGGQILVSMRETIGTGATDDYALGGIIARETASFSLVFQIM